MKTAKASVTVNKKELTLTPEIPKGNVTIAGEVKPVSSDNVEHSTGGTSEQISKAFKTVREKSPLNLPEN